MRPWSGAVFPVRCIVSVNNQSSSRNFRGLVQADPTAFLRHCEWRAGGAACPAPELPDRKLVPFVIWLCSSKGFLLLLLAIASQFLLLGLYSI